MTLVVDASVAIKWLLEEEDSAAARLLLSSGETLIAPELLLAEVCNVLWKRRSRDHINDDQARMAAMSLEKFVDEFVPMTGLFRRAYDLSRELAHPAYDCFYIALAESSDSVLVTADSRLLAGTGQRLDGRIRRLASA